MKIDFKKISSPVIMAQDEHYSYRDPAAWYQDGICYLYFTLAEQCEDGQYFYIGMSKSNDFIHWSEIKKLTPKDRSNNYSSPGNILPFGGKYYLCMQTYCREHGEIYGNDRSRIYIMETEDLEHFREPQLLRVKGDIPEEEMGRMIDPYLIEDKDQSGKYWCFYKQNGVSYSYSYNLKDWTYAGETECRENVCILVKDKEYYIFHSPEDGIGIMRSKDLVEFSDMGHIPIDKSQWDWAKDRLTGTLNLDSCEGVYVHNVVINNNRHVANTDGIDITGSSYVEIDHCFISTADDGIVLKNPIHTGRDMSDIYVHNCTVLTVMNSFKIGTETSGDISKVLVENCVFSLPDIYPGTTSGIAIESADGSVVKDITVRNIKMDKVICPLFICLNMRNRYGLPYTEDIRDKYWGGDISGILIENMEAVDAEAPSLLFGALSARKDGEHIRKPVSDITIRNFKVTYRETEEIMEVPETIAEYLYEYPENNTFGDVGAYGIWLRHADNVLLQDISIIPRSANKRECITYMDSSVTIL